MSYVTAILAIVAIAAVCTGVVTLGYGLVLRYRTEELSAATAGQLGNFGLVSGLLWTVGIGWAVGIDRVLTETVPGLAEAAWPMAATILLSFAAVGSAPAILVGFAASQFVVPGRSVRESLPSVLPRLVGLGASFVAVIAVLLGLVALDLQFLLPVLLAGLLLFLGPALGRLWLRRLPVREPDDAERDLLESVLSTTGFDRDRLHVVGETDQHDQVWRPIAFGFGPFMQVFVPGRLFDEYDHETLETILVVITSGSGLRIYRSVTWSVLFGSLFELWYLVEWNETLATVALFAWLAALPVAVWIGVRLVYRGDEAAAERVGRDRLADALERQRDRAGGEGDRISRFFLMTPSVGRRLDRLDRGSDGTTDEEPPRVVDA